MIIDDRRLEELSLNSSAPPGQLLYDGWIVRLLPGKAKRARSINAVYPSTQPLDAKIAHCEQLYRDAGLPALFRITPFSEPAGLDAALGSRGYGRFDTTAVESAPIDAAAHREGGATELPLSEWIHAVGDLRGSPREHRAAHLARIEGMPLPKRAVVVREGGVVVATGMTIVEAGAAGLFDVVTHEAHRRAGHARRLVASLLAAAVELGARTAYLQVEQGNVGARRLYATFGFKERYLYWYRARDPELA